MMVDLQLEEKFARPLPLPELKNLKQLQDMELLRTGSRLSVQPVGQAEFEFIIKLAKNNCACFLRIGTSQFNQSTFVDTISGPPFRSSLSRMPPHLPHHEREDPPCSHSWEIIPPAVVAINGPPRFPHHRRHGTGWTCFARPVAG